MLKPGGILYIDHEVCPNYWQGDIDYLEYLSQLGGNFSTIYGFEMGLSRKRNVLSFVLDLLFMGRLKKNIRMLVNKGSFLGQGDIHVFKDDHIEWM